MASNRYSPTKPSEALTSLGRGLQGLSQAIQQRQAFQQQQQDQNALALALGELQGFENDREGHISKLFEVTSQLGEANFGSVAPTFLQIGSRLTPQSKLEEETKEATVESIEAGTKKTETETDILDEGLRGLRSGPSDRIKELEALELDKAKLDVDISRARLNNLKKDALKKAEELVEMKDPLRKQIALNGLLLDLEALRQKIASNNISMTQAQSVYTPEYFRRILIELNKPLLDAFGKPVEDEATLKLQEDKKKEVIAQMKEFGYDQSIVLDTVTPFKFDLDKDDTLSDEPGFEEL